MPISQITKHIGEQRPVIFFLQMARVYVPDLLAVGSLSLKSEHRQYLMIEYGCVPIKPHESETWVYENFMGHKIYFFQFL